MGKSLQHIEVRGNAYERGWQSGHAFRKVLAEEANQYIPLLQNKEFVDQVEEIEKKMEKRYPEYLGEVRGRAAGAGIDPKVYFVMMCGEILGQGTGCTSIVYRRQDGSVILGHNEDDQFTIENTCLTKCITAGGWFVTSDFYTMPFGNGFSWNSHGIVKIVNYCHPLEQNLDGIPRYFAQRHISEAISIENFIERCKMEDRASGYHTIALDINSGRAVSVEITAERMSVVEIEEQYIHTNHYIHPQISGGQVYTADKSTSVFRLDQANKLLEELKKSTEEISREDISNILSYRGEGYEHSILAKPGDPHITFGTFSVDTRQKEYTYLDVHMTGEALKIQYAKR